MAAAATRLRSSAMIQNARQPVLRGIGAVLLVMASLAVVFIVVPRLATSAFEVPDSFALVYLLVLVASMAVCPILGWRLISDGRRSTLGVGLLFGSLLFLLPLAVWFLLLLGDALRES